MCCTGKVSKRAVRSSVTPQAAPKNKAATSIRKIARNTTTPVAIQRQYIIPRQICPKCGHPTMLVHIANRERQQCTNINCRLVIQ